ncbi:unnamed protein product [Ambrosiozyma monospora]|uniref:Unnamed protein product n=1 Tax=Ambrosiozyma monospora TaxID=43982 RepID=A0A9W6YPX4_AMBMO|nr:unnamed protein product [Ambrosiozyma monospora]
MGYTPETTELLKNHLGKMHPERRQALTPSKGLKEIKNQMNLIQSQSEKDRARVNRLTKSLPKSAQRKVNKQGAKRSEPKSVILYNIPSAMKEIKQADGLEFVPENEMDGFKTNLGSQLFQIIPGFPESAIKKIIPFKTKTTPAESKEHIIVSFKSSSLAKKFVQDGLTLLDHTGHPIHFTNANPRNRGGSSEPAIEYFQPYSTDRRKRNKLQEHHHQSNINTNTNTNTNMNTRNNNNNNQQSGNGASAPPIPGLSSAQFDFIATQEPGLARNYTVINHPNYVSFCLKTPLSSAKEDRRDNRVRVITYVRRKWYDEGIIQLDNATRDTVNISICTRKGSAAVFHITNHYNPSQNIDLYQSLKIYPTNYIVCGDFNIYLEDFDSRPS